MLGLTSGYDARIGAAVKGEKRRMGSERGEDRARQVDGSRRLKEGWNVVAWTGSGEEWWE